MIDSPTMEPESQDFAELAAHHPTWRFRWRDYADGRFLEGREGSDLPLVRTGAAMMHAAIHATLGGPRAWPPAQQHH